MADYPFPQKSAALPASESGIASITHNGRTFRFRTNPNEFRWTYTLNRRIDPTYGGRVIQLLGTKIDDFSLKAEAGNGRWDYINRMATFLRDVMVDQRGGEPAVFEYTKRGWKLNCYIVSVPFQDEFNAVLREFEISMKVQEDVSGLLSKNSLDRELRALADGIGFQRSKYNDPQKQGQDMVDIIGDLRGALPLDSLEGVLQTPLESIYLPQNSGLIARNLNIPGVGTAPPNPGR
ncbi:minor tail protein [Mycobacterium phage ScoobyDoobyDoo]|nr:minor tail protein [Mycobacterium phage ScoobyDoobyDoo]